MHVSVALPQYFPVEHTHCTLRVGITNETKAHGHMVRDIGETIIFAGISHDDLASKRLGACRYSAAR